MNKSKSNDLLYVKRGELHRTTIVLKKSLLWLYFFVTNESSIYGLESLFILPTSKELCNFLTHRWLFSFRKSTSKRSRPIRKPDRPGLSGNKLPDKFRSLRFRSDKRRNEKTRCRAWKKFDRVRAREAMTNLIKHFLATQPAVVRSQRHPNVFLFSRA